LEWLRARNLIEEEALTIPDNVEIVVTGRTSAKQKFKMPEEVSQRPFEKWPKPIRQYILDRKIDIYQVDRWKLGYSVDGRLGGRIVFPIEDENGILASYTARSFDGKEPRYTTPQPSENPDPTVLFGERYWPSVQERKLSTVVLTEGAINALACERAGAMYVAALGGSPLSPLDVGRDKPARASDGALAAVLKLAGWGRVLVATDPDRAGEKVSMAIRALARWTDMRRVTFPEGTDAADLPLHDLRELLREVSKNTLTNDYSVATTEA
ncbi:MAG: toprim domain-containing protein, partial [Patescibacteria group bacterium]|nr:toprim domain-containing protein [Patescibacteria group bacterium]